MGTCDSFQINWSWKNFFGYAKNAKLRSLQKKEVIANSPVEICIAMDGNWKRRRERFTYVDIENGIKKINWAGRCRREPCHHHYTPRRTPYKTSNVSHRAALIGLMNDIQGREKKRFANFAKLQPGRGQAEN